MKRLFFSLALIIYFQCSVCSQTQPNETTKAEFQKLEWVLGQWNRSNVREGQTASETWKRASNYILEGIGISMTGSDTTFVEKLRIEIKDNAIFYVADVKENATPTLFKITKLTENGFICENPNHDFPKMINYQLIDRTLTVVISDGGQKQVDFVFEKN